MVTPKLCLLVEKLHDLQCGPKIAKLVQITSKTRPYDTQIAIVNGYLQHL